MAHHGPAAFTTTHWSVVLEAQGESPAAQEALEKLCRTYWRPIYSFVQATRRCGQRRQRISPRGFSRLLLERGRSECRPEGKGATSFLSPWGAEIFSGRRAASRDGDQARKGQRLIPLEDTACRRTGSRWNRQTQFNCRANLRTPLGLDSSGARAQLVKGSIPEWRATLHCLIL